MGRPRIDLSGEQFGMYEVLNFICRDSRNGKSVWSCLCHGCQKTFRVVGSNLTDGKSKGCRKCTSIKRVVEDSEANKTPNKGEEHVKRYHDVKHIIDINLHLFREPLRVLHNAYITKTKGNAECAFKDILKIIKNLEKRRIEANARP